MQNYSVEEGKFGKYKTVILKNNKAGNKLTIAKQGATVLSYEISFKNELINIIDGFATPEEFEAARGARCWIMAPFANRIPGGKYTFQNQNYTLKPIPPRNNVIHGFTAYEEFEINNVSENDNFCEIELITKKIRKGVFEGYPFSLDVLVKFRLEGSKLNVFVTGENVGDSPLPFAPGWHPYFKAGSNGIENLIVTIDAESVILMDENLIPLEGEAAYGNIKDYPEMNYNSTLDHENRKVNNRVLDVCYANLKKQKDGLYKSSILNPNTGLKITMFQKEGFTLAFSGNSLSSRKRESIALEPMRFLTNAFNRKEFENELTIIPGTKKVFEFGVEISEGNL